MSAFSRTSDDEWLFSGRKQQKSAALARRERLF
jgi:hypothetical protein